MLNRFWPTRSRAGASAAGPVDSVELRHVDGTVAEQVHAFFAGRIPEFSADGDRAVRFAHPFKPGVEIKIKGGGFQGGFIQFGTLHNTGPKAPVFDYDGRMMEDVASGHDNAFEGGASFQQATTEYRMTQRLASLGYPVIPCLGFGRVEKAGLVSWFSVFEVQSHWAAVHPPQFSLEAYCEAKLSMGAVLRDLAVKHDLIGYAWYVGAPDGPYYIKDLHPFRMADPISMSQLSWVMQLYFALHLGAQAAIVFAKKAKSGEVPKDIQALPFRAILPEATKSDHSTLRRKLVKPYMRGVPRAFDQRKLIAVLRGNRVTKALLELCPAKYERY